jgi:hypothetical protein
VGGDDRDTRRHDQNGEARAGSISLTARALARLHKHTHGHTRARTHPHASLRGVVGAHVARICACVRQSRRDVRKVVRVSHERIRCARTGAPCDDRAQRASCGSHRGCMAPRALEASPPHLLTPYPCARAPLILHSVSRRRRRRHESRANPQGCAMAVVRRPTNYWPSWARCTSAPAPGPCAALARRRRCVGAVLARHMRTVGRRIGRRIGRAEEERLGSSAVLRARRPTGLVSRITPCPTSAPGLGSPLTHVRRIGCVRCRGMHRIGSDRIGSGLGWAGLGWAGLGWAGLGWAGLGWAA